MPSMKHIKFHIHDKVSSKRSDTKKTIEIIKCFSDNNCRKMTKEKPMTLDFSNLTSPYKEIVWMRNELEKNHIHVLCHESVIAKEEKYKK